MEKNQLIFDSQYDFRSKHSCEQAIGELVSEIIKNKELKKPTIVVCLDLSKAFDTLDYNLLMAKLERYGI